MHQQEGFFYTDQMGLFLLRKRTGGDNIVSLISYG